MADTVKEVPTEQLHFPAVPHWKTGVKCNGSIVAEQKGERVTLKCNECAAVVGTVNTEILKALEQAIADQFVIHKFTEGRCTRSAHINFRRMPAGRMQSLSRRVSPGRHGRRVDILRSLMPRDF
jgi:hypothetical protein